MKKGGRHDFGLPESRRHIFDTYFGNNVGAANCEQLAKIIELKLTEERSAWLTRCVRTIPVHVNEIAGSSSVSLTFSTT